MLSAETALAASMPALICSNSPCSAVTIADHTWWAVAFTKEAFPVTVSWSVVISRKRPTSEAIFLAVISAMLAAPAVSLPTSRLLICSLVTFIRSQEAPFHLHSATMLRVWASWTRHVSPIAVPSNGGLVSSVPRM